MDGQLDSAQHMKGNKLRYSLSTLDIGIYNGDLKNNNNICKGHRACNACNKVVDTDDLAMDNSYYKGIQKIFIFQFIFFTITFPCPSSNKQQCAATADRSNTARTVTDL